MKRLIILVGALSAVLLLSIYCTELENEFDNPWDKDGTKYNGGSRTIKFDPNANGIASPTSSKTNKYKKLDSLPTLTRDGYAFDGWYTTKTGTGGTRITTDTEFEGDATLYARWTLKTYEIAFNATDGTVSSTSGTTGDGWKLASLPTPTKSGYTFDSWYTAETGGTKVDVNNVYNDNSTIYAQWKINTYEITFNANGGTVTPRTAMTGDGWKLTSLPEPTRKDYTFNGWYTTQNGGDYVTVDWVYSANTTIYARWEANQVISPTYTITFNANGGTVNQTSGTTGTDGRLTSLPTPTRGGYKFDGWYTAAAGGTEVSTSTTFSANATIVARWTTESNYISKGNNINNYKTIWIGEQRWMAENLDYDVAGSKCYNNSNDSCAKYGRLYNWATAMGNNSSSSSNPSGVRGVCPTEWHLPSNAEWGQLEDAVGGFSTAGKKLKSASGWNNNGNDTDEYGFLALPGGYGNSDGNFDIAGYGGRWWSSTEYDYDVSNAWVLAMHYNREHMTAGGNVKTYLFSVRCVYDGVNTSYTIYTITFNANGGTVNQTSGTTGADGRLTSLPTPTRSGYSFDGWYTAATGGTNVELSRTYGSNATIYARWKAESNYISKGNNINNYKTIWIGEQRWMAENLDYDVADSKCYNNSNDSCAKYGRLYNWSTAMGNASSSSASPSGVRGVCPTGWHLPSDAEWAQLMNYVESQSGCSGCAGTKLKATSGWNYNGNGTDSYGFAALPGGGYSGGFSLTGNFGEWWSSTEDDGWYAWSRFMNLDDGYVDRNLISKANLFSVRCVQD